MSESSFDRWIPAILDTRGADPIVHWYLRGRARFDGTNFMELMKQLQRPFNQAFARQTPLDDLEAIAEASTCLPLAGIVAHMSRCGSTLTGKMLAATGHTRVVSEAGPIDTILRLAQRDPSIDGDLTVRRLRAMVKIFGRPGSERETHYVLKLDAWQAADLPIFARAFPQAPWVFLHRDPLEVLVSHAEGPSYMMSAAHAHVTLGMGVVEAMQLPRVELCARVLARIGERAIAAGVTAAQLVDYAELPDAVPSRIAPAFGLPVDDAAVTAMRAVTGMHAKRPGEVFAPDASSKRERATPEMREAAERLLAPVYDRLRSLD